MLKKIAQFFSCSTDYLLELDSGRIFIETTNLSSEQIAHIQQLVFDLEMLNKQLRKWGGSSGGVVKRSHSTPPDTNKSETHHLVLSAPTVGDLFDSVKQFYFSQHWFLFLHKQNQLHFLSMHFIMFHPKHQISIFCYHILQIQKHHLSF